MSREEGNEVAGARAEHFLPVALHDLFEALLEEESASERPTLRELYQLYVRLFRARLGEDRERLARAYAPLRPDEDLLDLSRLDANQRAARRRAVLEQLELHLIRANYRRLTTADLELALARESPYGLEVQVDLDDYAELALYTRGGGSEAYSFRSWRTAYLRSEQREAPLHRRLFLAIALHDAEDGGDLHLKLFRDVPETDLEMLLPNTRVRMRALDKVKLGVTGGGGAIGGIFSAVTKLGAAFNPVTAALAIGGLAGLVWRQVAGVLAQRTKYQAALKSRLYFHNLDNNQGALNHLLELAGAEECKEALLAYAFLRREPCDARTLDGRVERWLEQRFELVVDYEVADGLRKLREAGLLTEDRAGTGATEGLLEVVTPAAALERLSEAWIELGGAGQRRPQPQPVQP